MVGTPRMVGRGISIDFSLPYTPSSIDMDPSTEDRKPRYFKQGKVYIEDERERKIHERLYGSDQKIGDAEEIPLEDIKGRGLLRVRMTFEQFAAFLTSNSPIDCTFEHFYLPDIDAAIVERPPEFQSISERSKGRMRDVYAPLQEKAKKLLEKMEEKKAPKWMREEMKILHDHLASSMDFAITQTDNEVNRILEAAAGEIKRHAVEGVQDARQLIEGPANDEETAGG